MHFGPYAKSCLLLVALSLSSSLARAAETACRPGVLDCTEDAQGGTTSLKSGGTNNSTTSTAPPTSTRTDPATSGQASQQAAASVSTMTGTTHDSQNHVQANHTNMTRSGGSSSRSVGTMDIVEAILIMPVNPKRAAKLLLSGQQAHEAAAGLDAVAAKAQQNAGLMGGTPNLQGTSGPHAGQGNGAPAGSHDSSGASSPGGERAGELYGKFEDKYGIARDEIEAEAGRVRGNPEAIGSFMQEMTGDKSVGRDAVNAALDAYAMELGISRQDLFAAGGAKEFEASSAPASPSQPAPTAPKPDAGFALADAQRGPAAKEKDKKQSLREKIRKAMADRQGGIPTEGPVESLEPIRDQFFEKIKAEHDKELSLFDVVRAKYAEKMVMFERAPGGQ